MARVPLMVIRGGNSDILSPATVAAMQARHPAMTAIEVPDQGHAPLLCAPALISRIVAFAESCDRGRLGGRGAGH
jgi:pimeloyl-ACP methyl ester carboxylesterase